MKIIGIDPGLAGTGIGVIDGQGRHIAGYSFGSISTDAGESTPVRLDQIYRKTKSFLIEQQPDLVVIEDVYSLEKYPGSGIMLGKVSGVLILAAFKAGVPIREVAVREVKKVVSGNGSADKCQVERAVRHLLNHHEPIRPFHASDALGMALTGLFRYGGDWGEKDLNMIAYLEGKILSRQADGIILLAGHIGYEILLDTITLSLCVEKSQANETIALYIYYHVTERQPKPVLIGFLTPDDKEFFQLFITVAAIGPMKAIKALTKPVSQVARAIEDRDTAFLSQLTGIGKRTAEKIVATLNGKVLAFAATQSLEAEPASTEPTDFVPEEKQVMVRQVAEVLTEQLGHSVSSARRMINQALEKNPGISSPEDLFDEIFSGDQMTADGDILSYSSDKKGVVSEKLKVEDHSQEIVSLRPGCFDDYVGQTAAVETLKIAIQAAKMRREPLDHVLLHGPPGLGKTTVSHIIANEMGKDLTVTSGPTLEKGGDLVGILTNLGEGDILFVDEIHRIPKVVEEFLYPAMEDFAVDFVFDKGIHARSHRYRLKQFVLIGATTRVGLLSAPLRDRFGIFRTLDFYSVEELTVIIQRSALLLKTRITDDGALELAKRSRGTLRIANRLLKRVRDYAMVRHQGLMTAKGVQEALDLEGIDDLGLTPLDRNYLETIIRFYNGGPVGIEAISATLQEETDTLVDVVEPYLLKIGLVLRTSSGRKASENAYRHLNLEKRG